MHVVVYRVGWEQADTHRFEVRIDLPAGHGELTFPAWAPGSYLMREFAKNVRNISAHLPDGTPLTVHRPTRNHWRVDTEGPWTLRYQLYAREKSVRTPFLDGDLAFFVPTNLLPFARDHRDTPVVLEIDVPAGHTGVCPLGEPVAGPAIASWRADDIDIFYDSPVAIGPFEYRRVEVRGVAHHHYIEPGHDGDVDRMATDLGKIVVAAADLMGGEFPYSAYTFISLLTRDGHGGLEHLDSSVLLRPRRGFRNSKGYEEFLTLAAHEHFHAWNVKRIRPDTLSAPFAYDRENHSRNLWWLEGGTVYYEERIVLRAGLVTESRYYERLADLVRRLDRSPGRRHQPLEESSWDAWTKLYRPGEDSLNSGISYYLKGAVVCLALDLEMLRRSKGAAGTDQLLALLWQRYASKGLPFPEEGTIEALAAELVGGGGDWARWWDRHIRGSAEVELAEALEHVGLSLVRGARANGSYLGIEVSGAERIQLTAVREDGPAWGLLSPGDELLAIGGERILASELSSRLADTPPHSVLRLLISRDARILERSLRTGLAPEGELKIVPREGADDQQLALRYRWLGIPAQVSGSAVRP
jgi:predicted metalloprotease with PDZ domain